MYDWSHRMLHVHLCIKIRVDEIIFQGEQNVKAQSDKTLDVLPKVFLLK